MERQDFGWNALQVRELQRYSNASGVGMARNARDNSGCGQCRRASEISRREALRIGGLVGFGLGLPELLAAQESGRGSLRDLQPPQKTFGRAKSIIVLYLHGGHPQQETFDPKPNGPS